MARPISKAFLKKVEVLESEIDELISEARTVDQAGHLQNMLDNAATWADQRVCDLDTGKSNA
jgi:hypothetical protein